MIGARSSYEIIQHLALVDKSEDRSDGAWLSGHKWVSAELVDTGGDDDQVCKDDDAEGEGDPERQERLFAGIGIVSSRLWWNRLAIIWIIWSHR